MTVHWEDHGDHVGVITIDRQERRNALNPEICDEVREHLEAHEKRAIVITGAGSAFCSGADLVTRFGDTLEREDTEDLLRPSFEAMVEAVVAYPAPVLAAVNGPAMGAGMQLAVACDLRVVARSAKLGIPAGNLGVHISAPNVARLGRLVGQAAARDVLLGSTILDADAAFRYGIAQRVVDDARAGALEWAEDIATKAPLTLRGHKRALNLLAEAQDYSADQVAEVEECEARAFASEDLVEGIAAFTEKRVPQFRGR